MSFTALISQAKGVALFSQYGLIQQISVARPNEIINCSDRQLHEFAGAKDVETVEVADLHALKLHLRLRRNREELLAHALAVLNGELSDDVRGFAAEKLCQNSFGGEHAWVEGVISSAPLPTQADPVGAAKSLTPFSDFYKRLPGNQKKIAILFNAWNILTNDNFGVDVAPDMRARAVRRGIFRVMLENNGNYLSPFADDLHAYSRQLEAISWNGLLYEHSAIHARIRSMTPLKLNAEAFGTTAPWRAAWFEADWGRLESIFSIKAASRIFKTATFDILKLWHDKKDATTEFVNNMTSAWQRLHRQAEWVSPLNQLYDFTSTREFVGKSIASQLKLGKSRASLKLDSNLTRTKDSDGYSIFMDSSEKSNAWDWLTIRAEDRVLESNRTEGENYLDRLSRSIASDYSSSEDGHGRQMAVEIKSLGRIFANNGCVVTIIPSTSMAERERRAILVNLQNSKNSRFAGFYAVVLERLQARLVSDLQSGLPITNCGWESASQLCSDDSVESGNLASMVKELRTNLEQSGLSGGTIEHTAGFVRLNPSLAAPSS